MTRITLFSLLTMMLTLTSVNASTNADQTAFITKTMVSQETVQKDLPDAGTQHTHHPAIPATKPAEHPKKSNSSKLEELAHIHLFHKERVKKLKRHHSKVWLLSKVFLIVCHLLLLMAAYMHVTH